MIVSATFWDELPILTETQGQDSRLLFGHL
jgi:hypothetical protein